MVIVHLIAYEVQFGDFLKNFFTDYTRFAAGGFVFLSGLCMGMIFLPKVIASGEQIKDATLIYRRIWMRSLKILLVQFGAVIALIALGVYPNRGEMAHPRSFLGNLLTFRKGYADDLLMLYVGMLAITPLLLEMMRRGLWAIVAACSGLVFVVGSQDPWHIAFVPKGEFPVVLWQAVFIGGILFTQPLRAFDRARKSARAGVLVLLAVSFAVFFLSANAPELGLKHRLINLEFSKIPLTFGELMRYMVTTLLIMLATNAIWRRIRETRAVAFICLLGRNSLFVYVAHLFVQPVIAELAWRNPGWGMWQIGFAFLMIAILGMLAFWMEQLKKGKHPEQRARRVLPTERAEGQNEGSLLAVP